MGRAAPFPPERFPAKSPGRPKRLRSGRRRTAAAFLVAAFALLAFVQEAAAQAPPTPTNFQATYVSSTEARVSWDTVTEDGVHVEIRIQTGGTWQSYFNPDTQGNRDSGRYQESDGTSSYLFRSLTEGQSYSFQIRACRGNCQNRGNRSSTGQISGFVLSPPPPANTVNLSVAPTSVSEGATGGTTMTVTGSFPSGSATLPHDVIVTVSVGGGDSTATSVTDYAAVADFTLTISGGMTSGTADFTFTPVDDTASEGNETVEITATTTDTQITTLGATEFTIEDNDVSASVSATDPDPLTEADGLDNATVTVDLSAVEYVTSLQTNHFTLNTDPAISGLSVGSVSRTSNTRAVLTLDHDLSDFDGDLDVELTVTVKAAAHTGSSDLTTAAVTVEVVPPAAKVTGVTLTPGDGEITVAWAEAENADSYDVEWRSGANYDPFAVPAVSGQYNVPSFFPREHVIGGLASARQYTVRVRARRDLPAHARRGPGEHARPRPARPRPAGTGWCTSIRRATPAGPVRYGLSTPGRSPTEVVIEGTDGDGASPGSAVSLSVPARSARRVTAQALESADARGEDLHDLSGALGDGAGKWRLVVRSDQALQVMSLVSGPAGQPEQLVHRARRDGDRDPHRRRRRGRRRSGPPPPALRARLRCLRAPELRAHRQRVATKRARCASTPSTTRGMHYGPLTLYIGAHEALQFNSRDLETGNPDQGLDGATGAGEGRWRLALSSDLDLEVLGYLRMS